jgi:hypothetical protein
MLFEIPGHRTGPSFEDGRRGQALEGAIDLDRPKTLAVKTERLKRRECLGIGSLAIDRFSTILPFGKTTP